jgi:hypothetical protein
VLNLEGGGLVGLENFLTRDEESAGAAMSPPAS